MAKGCCAEQQCQITHVPIVLTVGSGETTWLTRSRSISDCAVFPSFLSAEGVEHTRFWRPQASANAYLLFQVDADHTGIGARMVHPSPLGRMIRCRGMAVVLEQIRMQPDT
eukprot:scaffold315390_cov22-Tisochrysis_lutea.AAC.1